MDAVKFIEERNRMCGTMSEVWGVDAAQIVKSTEKWAAAHPHKTRQSVFLEQWPNCTKDATGVINLCPRYFDTGYICSGTEIDCAKCRSKFWGKVVE